MIATKIFPSYEERNENPTFQEAYNGSSAKLQETPKQPQYQYQKLAEMWK
jgi:hypothetical protein